MNFELHLKFHRFGRDHVDFARENVMETAFRANSVTCLAAPQLMVSGDPTVDTGGELVEGLGYRNFTLSSPTQNIDFMNSPPVSLLGSTPCRARRVDLDDLRRDTF